MIRSRPQPPAQKELDFEFDLGEFYEEEVLRRTTKGMAPVDVNYIEIDDDDYIFIPTGIEDEDDTRS